MSYMEFKNICKTYHMSQNEICALDKMGLEIEKGEQCIIVGSSGAGKTNILGGMDAPTSGAIKLDGHDISALNVHEMTDYRITDIGFVFQSYNLVQNLTARIGVRNLQKQP